VESTVVAKGRFEVRGGTLRVASASGTPSAGGAKAGTRGKEPSEPSPVFEIEIGPETNVVGRNEACDLVLDDRKVSAVHMELVATERGVRVRDLGSRNGTFLGETRVGEVYLLKPTRLVCGDTVLEFTPSTPEEVSVPDAA